MRAVHLRAAARRDLVEHYVYLGENAGEGIADRFLACVEATFTRMTEHPHMGAPLTLRRPELAGVRKWPVEDFEKFLIFYMPRENGISVVRVLHAAQDWWGALGVE
jgi:toxin ParE1/3/4